MNNTATPLEIASTVTMGIAFIATVAALAWASWKYHVYRTPNEIGHRANGLGTWIFIRDALVYGAFAVLTGALFWLSWRALWIPPAILPDNRKQSELAGWVLIGLAVVVDVFVLANLLIGWRVFRREEAGKIEAASNAKDREANIQAAATNALDAAANASDSAANSFDALTNASDASANASVAEGLAKRQGNMGKGNKDE